MWWVGSLVFDEGVLSVVGGEPCVGLRSSGLLFVFVGDGMIISRSLLLLICFSWGGPGPVDEQPLGTRLPLHSPRHNLQ